MTMLRTRWAAIGAAVAVSLGAGGIGLSQAAINSGEKPVYVSITPCRLIDTRGNVGDRTAPLSGGDTLTLQITGSTGECTGIPADAVAAAMNVTAIRGTTRSFLTVYPQDAALPNASNLNWNGGDPPTPNKVDVALSASGAVKMTNDAGTVHIAADLVGYYTDHTHDDRYYRKGQVDTAIDAATAGKADAADVDAALAGKADSSAVYTKAEIDARKFININTMRDVEGLPANAPFGGGLDRFDTSLIVPPDYTPGTPMTLSINVFKSDLSPFASCQVDLRSNYVYAMHPSTATNFPGTLSGRTTVTLDAVRWDIETVDFTLSGAFVPGDSVTFGLFAAAAGTTCGSDTAYHSAALYYD